MTERISDIAFTDSVKSAQRRLGSRRSVETMIQERDWPQKIDPALAEFIAQSDSFYLATAGADGQPYIQHRGGPKGFLKILDERTLAFADYAGNRQFISTGNLADNDRVFIFLMDYANRRRFKLWGRAEIVEDDAELTARVSDPAYRQGRAQRVFVFRIKAWDVNCPAHITRRFDEAEVAALTESLRARIGELEAEKAAMRARLERKPE
ncbi:MAG: pyridoxamine 5'-phosphate oxidase family protein [Planctomycetota bacterium]|nr:pyridoxamine 5'-phosphate oxidase family protein [Planctomycetota bacterium]